MKYDFVAFGDIVIDAFIRLSDAHTQINPQTGDQELCVKFGQKIPFDSVQEVLAVGNGPNAAVAALRLGVSATLVANVGDDRNGDDCIKHLQGEGMNPEFIQKHAGIKTNYHYVLMYEAERTILVKHEPFPYLMPHFSEAPSWFYLTSLPLDTLNYQLDIARYAKANNVKVAFQPGTFQMQLGKEALKEVYEVTEVFFCNKEEAQQILGTKESDIKILLEGIRSLGPKTVIITDGRNGGYVLEEGGAFHIPMYPDPAPPISRTGAGDATSSTTVVYMIKGLPAREALMRGMVNSAYVVQKVGAQTGLLTADELEAAFTKRPADFTPVQL